MRHAPVEPVHSIAWSEADDAILAEHWGNISSSKIGLKLGRSKNSVVGRAHRIELPKQASPLGPRADVSPEKRATQKREYLRRRKEAEKLGVPFRRQNRVVTLPQLSALRPIPERQQQNQDPLSKTLASLTAIVADVKAGRVAKSSCCWPLGDPKDKNFRFCCEPTLLGKSYCRAHNQRAYYKKAA